MLTRISDLGCNGKAYHEGRSFMSGKLGKKVMGENVTIWDDGLDRRGLVCPFDFEGAPKQKVEIIKNGIAKNVVYDSYQALKEGKKNTGHALPAPSILGPLACNLFMKEGKYSKNEMKKSIKKGIWVTRFWYTNILHHKLLNMTGMTRDGTFLIENGEIVGGLKNLRFTQSIPEAFCNIQMIGKDVKIQDSWFLGNVVPALKIKDFNFTGVTQF
jgi:predicted Zn-dependent protease